MRRCIKAAAVVALVAFGAWGQFHLRAQRVAAAPALAEGAFAALGGIRSLMAEVIWFRADRLQDEGRYVELAQLAGALTAMEPHTPEVWSYAAWNLAYNVSVMMATEEDRWRWVHAGLRLLRDEGLRLNPHEGELYRELAWMFELKLGANLDSAAPTYRRKWAAIVEDVARRDAWEELAMERAHKTAVEKATGYTDWTDPQLSAIYWGTKGMPYARPDDRRFIVEILKQANAIYRKNHSKESKDKVTT